MPPHVRDFCCWSKGGRNDGDTRERTIGKITLRDKEIVKESEGITVYEGSCGGAVVKCISRAHYYVDLEAIEKLTKSRRHSNIVRVNGLEHEGENVYLALDIEEKERTCSLDGLIQALLDPPNNSVLLDRMKDYKLWTKNGHPSTTLLELMSNVVSGLAFLHGKSIIHGNLKPENVLITKNGSLVAQLSDIGIHKRLPEGTSSLGVHATRWQAPEQLRGGPPTCAADVFSLGCVLFFCVTRGRHPFGDTASHDHDFATDKIQFQSMESIPEAVDLFKRLLNPLPQSRLKASEVLRHPFSWSSNTRLSFLRDFSDIVNREAKRLTEQEESKGKTKAPNLHLLNKLESRASEVLESNKWKHKIEPEVMTHLYLFRTYDDNRLRDLLRAARNLISHRADGPENVLKITGEDDEDLDAYLDERFKKLLIESYRVAFELCKSEKTVQKYFRSYAQFTCWGPFRRLP